MVFVVVLLAELLAIVLTLAQPSVYWEQLYDLAIYSLFSQWVALSCIGVLCLLQPRLRRLPQQWTAALSYAAVLAVSLLITELAWHVMDKWLVHTRVAVGHLGFLLRSLGVSAIAWALALRYFYVQHQWREKIESEANARFQALQSRIRPHFLFNCMNTIANLTRNTPKLAEQAVEDLADLFRASLREARQTSSISEEIAICRGYLRIEQHRLGDRLRVEWENIDSLDDLSLPVLILQPLLENAIYHGIETRPSGGVIRISATQRANAAQITITNPLPDPGLGDGAHRGNRLALNNVKQRLDAFFGRNGLLKIHGDSDEFRVTIIIPRERENSDR
jgi:two-component system sensor histidine kinase AlgZ